MKNMHPASATSASAESVNTKSPNYLLAEALFDRIQAWLDQYVRFHPTDLYQIIEAHPATVAMREWCDAQMAQLRMCESHAGTMAKDFDASLAVVQKERDELRAKLYRWQEKAARLEIDVRDMWKPMESDRDWLRTTLRNREETLKQEGERVVALQVERDQLRIDLAAASAQADAWHTELIEAHRIIEDTTVQLAQMEHDRDSLLASNVTFQRLCREAQDAAVEAQREWDEVLAQFEAKRIRDVEDASLVASCNCLVKSPEVRYHKPGCKYRLISERDRAIAELGVTVAESANRGVDLDAARAALRLCRDALNQTVWSGEVSHPDVSAANVRAVTAADAVLRVHC